MTLSRALFALLAVALTWAVPATAGAPPSTGDADSAAMDVLVDTLRTNRRAFVEVNLALNEEQAARFWPLYDRYESEMRPFADRTAALIEDYGANYRTLSDEKALQLMRDYLTIEAERLAVRRKYLDEFAAILPGRTVARFYQLENKMDAVLRYDLAAGIPVVDEAPADAPGR